MDKNLALALADSGYMPLAEYIKFSEHDKSVHDNHQFELLPQWTDTLRLDDEDH